MSLSGESGGGEQMIWIRELRLSHFCVFFFGFLCVFTQRDGNWEIGEGERKILKIERGRVGGLKGGQVKKWES